MSAKTAGDYGGDMLWQPDSALAAASRISEFMHFANETEGQQLSDYDALWSWSVSDLGGFWRSVWDYTDIIGEAGSLSYHHDEDIKQARFFPEAKLNFAENMLRYHGSEDAIIEIGEDGKRASWSHDDLRHDVSRIQQALQAAGIQKGDRVAGIVPNTAQTISFMLAVTSLGAVWSSCSPDFGFVAAMDRLAQIEPKIIISADGYLYNGKHFSSLEVGAELLAAISSVTMLIRYEYTGTLPAYDEAKTALWADAIVAGQAVPQDCHIMRLDEFIAPFAIAELQFEPVRFADPLYIMFSSGTTGLPKCIVHSVGGTLLKHKAELILQGNIHEGDRLFYFTTCGWMMWNWSISALSCGASLVLFDGSPFYPEASRFAEIIAAENVTHFGTSAKYIDACAKAGLAVKHHHNIAQLRMIFSTGSPLSEAGFDYIYDKWADDICLASIAGGTDIIGCFVGGSPISPVFRGQCQKRLLGMDVAVFDDDGQPVMGQKGELVCLSPHPSMPTNFWNDEDGSRYHKAYFARFDNVWHHGDCVALTDNGGMIFYGRSDATLNPGGVRIGTAEIYRQVEAINEVLEAVVVGQDYDDDMRIVLFVRLREGLALDDDLKAKIKQQIRRNATPRHVPAVIIQIADIPRTKSGKITELAVRDIIHGKEIDNVGALANPEALALYRNLPELQ